MVDIRTTSPGAFAPAPAVAPEEHVDPRRLVAFLAMVFGMFMAILDIQIVSASLTEIQAGLAASSDEVSWVQTAYLIAEVVMIPLSGFLSRALGTRIVFAASAAGFTVASFMCGQSNSIDEMIVWRAAQGFIGGGMIPTVFATAFTIFPRSKIALVSPMIGLVATMAPTIGPTVGGYLTDAFSWHWLFFVNVVPGIAVTLASLVLIDFDKPDFALLRRLDWFGLAFMAGFLGSLEYVLEEGPRNDWFSDDTILTFAWTCGISAVLFFWRALSTAVPIVDLRSFTNRNFALGSLFSFVLGIGLYGLTLLYPLYLGQIRGYNALMIGETMFISGLAMFLTAPVAGKLADKLDARIMLMFGFLCFAAGTWGMTYVTRDWDFWELLWPQIFRGVGMMLAIVPINSVALGALPPDRVKNASGLYNLMRNLGGAVGLAGINTLLNDRTDLHLARLHEALTWVRPPVLEALDGFAAHFQSFGGGAKAVAMKQLMMVTHRQGVVMAFGDVFLMLTVAFAGLAFLTLIMAKPSQTVAGGH
jgi:DHA2 family multidrug resistance protein